MSRELKTLSKIQKIELLDAIQEKKRRGKLRRANYAPNPGQLPVHSCDKKVRFVASANAAGKTCMAVHEAIWSCLGYNPVLKKYTKVPVKSVAVLDRPDKVKDVWCKEIEKWFDTEKWQFHKDGKPHISRISFPNGSELIFLFHQTEPLAFESIEVQGLVCFDEPPPRHIWVGLYRGGRTKGYQTKYLIIGTPISATWLRKDIYDPWSRGQLSDTECFRFSIEVNRSNLAEGYIESFSRILTENEKAVRLKGLFAELDGLALAHIFDRSTHVIPQGDFFWNSEWTCVVAIDYHPSKDNIACLLGVDRDGHYYYLKELTSASPPAQFARELRDFMSGYRVRDIVCDSLGATPRSGGEGNASFLEVLKKYGVQVRTTTFKEKSDEDFISRIQHVLEIPEAKNKLGQRIPKLRILEGCKGIISDIENVSWQKYRNLDVYRQALDITNKDYLACLKYALAANPMPGTTKSRVIRPNNPSPWGRHSRSG